VRGNCREYERTVRLHEMFTIFEFVDKGASECDWRLRLVCCLLLYFISLYDFQRLEYSFRLEDMIEIWVLVFIRNTKLDHVEVPRVST
jgi:hypothetical protein